MWCRAVSSLEDLTRQRRRRPFPLMTWDLGLTLFYKLLPLKASFSFSSRLRSRRHASPRSSHPPRLRGRDLGGSRRTDLDVRSGRGRRGLRRWTKRPKRRRYSRDRPPEPWKGPPDRPLKRKPSAGGCQRWVRGVWELGRGPKRGPVVWRRRPKAESVEEMSALPWLQTSLRPPIGPRPGLHDSSPEAKGDHCRGAQPQLPEPRDPPSRLGPRRAGRPSTRLAENPKPHPPGRRHVGSGSAGSLGGTRRRFRSAGPADLGHESSLNGTSPPPSRESRSQKVPPTD